MFRKLACDEHHRRNRVTALCPLNLGPRHVPGLFVPRDRDLGPGLAALWPEAYIAKEPKGRPCRKIEMSKRNGPAFIA